MTHRMRRIASWTIAAVIVASCASGDIRDANDKLTNFYAAKVQAEASDDWGMLETSVASLKALSVEAAGQAASEENDLNKVSLYRVAATAAWQGDNEDVVNYGRAGQELCTDAVYTQVPRDCGLLMVIPTLASIDATTSRLNQLQDDLDAAGDAVTPQLSEEANQIKDAYFESLDRLLNVRPKIQQSDAHPDFKAGVDSNIVRIQCELLDGTTRGVIVLTNGSVSQFSSDLKLRGCRMLDDGFAEGRFACAPQNCN